MNTALGVHRSIDPPGVLPQAARRLDPSLPIRFDEILIGVERLNVDSASFLEFEKLAVAAGVPVEETILNTVRERGKLQNPVTGSGGMLATLVSLTLTPLHLDAIEDTNRDAHQLAARGHAILFASGLWAPLPGDLPEALALAIFDVAGAPAAVDRMVGRDDDVLVLGCGKAGLLALARARTLARARSRAARVFAVDADEAAVRAVLALDLADEAAVVDAADAPAVLDAVAGWTSGRLCSKVFNFASGSGTEAASILAARESGTVFRMDRPRP